MLKNVLDCSIKRRNDFCYLLGEIIDNCSIDNELPNDIITGILVYFNIKSMKIMKNNYHYIKI